MLDWNVAAVQAYGKRAYLITTFKEVPRGTEGAVSLEGTAAGMLAALGFASLALALGQVRRRLVARMSCLQPVRKYAFASA